METRRYKVHAGVGGSKWETGSTLSMLESMPTVNWYLRYYRVVPPLHVLNELLATGRDDAGMSGGCEWRPFSLDPSEYTELAEELCTSPDYQCELDAELSQITTNIQWGKAIHKKYNSIARDRLAQ